MRDGVKLGTRGNSEGWSWGHGGGVSEGWVKWRQGGGE